MVSSILHSVSREIQALVINDRTMKCNQRSSTIYTEKYLLFRIADSCTQRRGCNNLNNDAARPVNTDLLQYASQCLRYAALHVPQLFDKLTPVETVPTERVASHRFISLLFSLSLSLVIFSISAHMWVSFSFFSIFQHREILHSIYQHTLLSLPYIFSYFHIQQLSLETK